MEKMPNLRVIGNASPEIKEREREKYEKKLFAHSENLSEEEKEIIEKFEKEKTPREFEAINIISDEINNLRLELGLPDLTIPYDNYHIFDKDFYENTFGDSSAGQTHFRKQGIVLNEEDVRTSLLAFTGITLHESLHLQGHLTLEVNKYDDDDGYISTTEYRQGISTYPPQKQTYEGKFHTHLDGVHEAIVAEQEKRSLKKLIQLPIFDEDRKQLFSEEVENIKEIIINKEPGMNKEDILWIDKDGDNIQRQVIGYPGQRKVLNFVCDNILKKFPEKFSSQDEVFNLFLKAQFTGKLLDIARLTEETFGDGSFRRLSDMEVDEQGAVKTLEALKKMKVNN